MAESQFQNLSNNAKKLQILLQGMEEDHLSREDFTRAFEALTKSVRGVVENLKQENSNERGVMSQELQQALKKMEDSAQSLTSQLEKTKEEMRSDNRTTMRMFGQKLKQVEDLIEYYDDSEVRSLLEEVKDSIPKVPEAFDPSEIQSQVEKNTKEIEELKKRPVRGVSGGTTDRSLQFALNRIVKTETPTGTVDGANTDFNVSSTIHAILGFELNSRSIDPGTYTITGSKRMGISFDSAIPASYSGKQFTIIYI